MDESLPGPMKTIDESYMRNQFIFLGTVLLLSAAFSPPVAAANGAGLDLTTPTLGTGVVVATAVVVGFIMRCRRKGLPFRSSKS